MAGIASATERDTPTTIGAQTGSSFVANETDVKTQRSVVRALAALTLLAATVLTGAVLYGVFKPVVILAVIPLVLIVGGLIYFASHLLDYKNPDEVAAMKSQTANLRFIDIYRTYGLETMARIFTRDELKQRFDAEVQDPKTTFWNVIRRYNCQALHDKGVITHDHLLLLQRLGRDAQQHNHIVFMGKEHHVLTVFANQPEAFKHVIALDAEYKETLQKLASGEVSSRSS